MAVSCRSGHKRINGKLLAVSIGCCWKIDWILTLLSSPPAEFTGAANATGA